METERHKTVVRYGVNVGSDRYVNTIIKVGVVRRDRGEQQRVENKEKESTLARRAHREYMLARGIGTCLVCNYSWRPQ